MVMVILIPMDSLSSSYPLLLLYNDDDRRVSDIRYFVWGGMLVIVDFLMGDFGGFEGIWKSGIRAVGVGLLSNLRTRVDYANA